jgi:hypothetical protein
MRRGTVLSQYFSAPCLLDQGAATVTTRAWSARAHPWLSGFHPGQRRLSGALELCRALSERIAWVKNRCCAPDFGCLGASSAKVRYAEGVARPAFFTKNAGYPSAAKISGIGPTDVAPSVSLECRWVCSSRFTHRKKRVSGGTGPR